MSACTQKDQKQRCPWATIPVRTSCEPSSTNAESYFQTNTMLFIHTQQAFFLANGCEGGYIIYKKKSTNKTKT